MAWTDATRAAAAEARRAHAKGTLKKVKLYLGDPNGRYRLVTAHLKGGTNKALGSRADAFAMAKFKVAEKRLASKARA